MSFTEDHGLARVQQGRKLKELLEIQTELEKIKAASKMEELDLKWIQDISTTLENDKFFYNALSNHIADREPSAEQREKDETTVIAYKTDMATTLSLCTFCTSLKLMSNACLALDDNISDLTSLMTGGSETSYSENMKLLKEDHSYLKRVLIDSPVPRTKSAKTIILKSSQLLAKLSTPVSADVKPITSKLDGDSL